MIGRSEWFSRRKYLGWGLMPRTWQGVLYVVVFVLPLVLIPQYHLFGQAGAYLMTLWLVLFIADIGHMMLSVPRDERERMHEAIAERNALWAMLTILIVGAGLQATGQLAGINIQGIDPAIVAALIGALVVKAASNVYMDRKD